MDSMAYEKRKDELLDEAARTGNARKKTAKWCKGKVGREHESELVINHNVVRLECGWFRHRAWMQQAWHWRPYHYSCIHSYRCKNCGKYLEWVLKDVTQCPDYTPLEQ
jgi:hypothetical protein